MLYLGADAYIDMTRRTPLTHVCRERVAQSVLSLPYG
jgi:hypothetical protein